MARNKKKEEKYIMAPSIEETDNAVVETVDNVVVEDKNTLVLNERNDSMVENVTPSSHKRHDLIAQSSVGSKMILLTPTFRDGYPSLPIIWGNFEDLDSLRYAVASAMAQYGKKEPKHKKSCLLTGILTGYRFCRRPLSVEGFQSLNFVNFEISVDVLVKNHPTIHGRILSAWMDAFGFEARHIGKAVGVSTSYVNKTLESENVPVCLYALYLEATENPERFARIYNLRLIEGLSFDPSEVNLSSGEEEASNDNPGDDPFEDTEDDENYAEQPATSTT